MTVRALRWDKATFVLAVAVVLVFPLVGLPRAEEQANLPPELFHLYAADVVLLALALLSLPRLITAAWRARGIGLLWLALFALLALAFVIHPSPLGVDLLLDLLTATALYHVVADLADRRRTALTTALAITAILQACIAVIQVAVGAPLGFRALGESGEGLITYGGPPLARGTLSYEFILAALALASANVLCGEGLRGRNPARWLVSAALAISSAGLVYGRTVAIAFALGCLSLARGATREPRLRSALVAMVLGAGFPALIASEGWAWSLSRGVASDRGVLIAQAFELIADAPLVGVGPGNYLHALRTRPVLHVTAELENVHNVAVIVAAEAGIAAGAIVVGLLVAIGYRAYRAGTPALALYLTFLPFMILDVLSYATPQGMVLTALWLAFLRHAESIQLPSRWK